MRYKNKMSSTTIEFNMKCVIFGGVLAVLYWVVSKSGGTNYWAIPIIFLVAYATMSLYDSLYKCNKTF